MRIATKTSRRRRLLSTVALLALLAGCASPQVATAPPLVPAPPVSSWTAPPKPKSTAIRVPLWEAGGTPVVKVAIAGVCCFNFTVDSGAADVAVSPALFRAMVKGGHVTEADIIDIQKYRTAGGHVVEGLRFRMPPMTVGGHTVYGVVGSVTKGATMLLLGNSFLRNFKSFAFDLQTSELVLVAAKIRIKE